MTKIDIIFPGTGPEAEQIDRKIRMMTSDLSHVRERLSL